MVTPNHIGRLVRDSLGREGILRAVMKDWENPAVLPPERKKQDVAFLGPVKGGGKEWMVDPQGLTFH